MEANAEETSALIQWDSTMDVSPRDGPSDKLEGLGTLAYHIYAEQLISSASRFSNNTTALLLSM